MRRVRRVEAGWYGVSRGEGNAIDRREISSLREPTFAPRRKAKASARSGRNDSFGKQCLASVEMTVLATSVLASVEISDTSVLRGPDGGLAARDKLRSDRFF
jgi:hypothetical protein